MTRFRPLLGAVVDDLDDVHYPVFASTKLDGIRAIWWGKEFLSRTLKTIPNRALPQYFRNIPATWDGELISGAPNASDVFRKTTSAVMTQKETIGSIRFFVFDNIDAEGPFYKRLDTIIDLPPLVIKLDQILMDSASDLFKFEQETLAAGYEGVVLRSPEGSYKHGRSTLREQYLLKLKRFKDAEATVVGFEELLHNANTLSKDERGYAKRSLHQENLIPMGMLGSITVQMDSLQFNIGTGFTQGDRVAIWEHRDEYLGRLAKFKYLQIGIKDAPRHPVFLGWRSRLDS